MPSTDNNNSILTHIDIKYNPIEFHRIHLYPHLRQNLLGQTHQPLTTGQPHVNQPLTTGQPHVNQLSQSNGQLAAPSGGVTAKKEKENNVVKVRI